MKMFITVSFYISPALGLVGVCSVGPSSDAGAARGPGETVIRRLL